MIFEITDRQKPDVIKTVPTISPRVKSFWKPLKPKPSDLNVFLSMNRLNSHAVINIPINPNNEMMIFAVIPRSLIKSRAFIPGDDKSRPIVAAIKAIAIELKIAVIIRAEIRNNTARSQPYLIRGVGSIGWTKLFVMVVFS